MDKIKDKISTLLKIILLSILTYNDFYLSLLMSYEPEHLNTKIL